MPTDSSMTPVRGIATFLQHRWAWILVRQPAVLGEAPESVEPRSELIKAGQTRHAARACRLQLSNRQLKDMVNDKTYDADTLIVTSSDDITYHEATPYNECYDRPPALFVINEKSCYVLVPTHVDPFIAPTADTMKHRRLWQAVERCRAHLSHVVCVKRATETSGCLQTYATGYSDKVPRLIRQPLGQWFSRTSLLSAAWRGRGAEH